MSNYYNVTERGQKIIEIMDNHDFNDLTAIDEVLLYIETEYLLYETGDNYEVQAKKFNEQILESYEDGRGIVNEDIIKCLLSLRMIEEKEFKED